MDPDAYMLPPLLPGRLIKRYKRFLADICLDSGETVTAHCPNSGSMKGCAVPGCPVWLSVSDNPRRKLKYTWELIKTPASMIGINTLVPNRLVKKAIENHMISELNGYSHVRSEVKTSEGTRLDLVLEGAGKDRCYVEIKNCTLVEDGTAMFPDAVTLRGQKHLDELMHLVKTGHRGVIFYLIQRMDAARFTPAAMIDQQYADKLREAADNGVEIVIRDVQIDLERIRINRPVPFVL
ncbi:DNA/RNA nuclease SfsA [Desulfotignum phosphitoxidans]|jgi:sugar fermentation stimulation protein A|uniref:Sugar fermentation stimulation protein homolog n=1 Tax=Desulfotignum phosphitoxidans DSM 13687 TaxID=1286635 RepID=S0G1I9_9BACT|nr:DNA/RNA nuclease SfsA [Desulfotignum phosphitoxidans]EMS78042.1 sugar fermentation stimulation protein SfsA [Desulfotignum phosphitoxidans DSM 13687]